MPSTKLFSIALAVLGVVLSSACVRTPPRAEPASAPKAAAPPSWAATHYKVGARLYPRCMTMASTGSRVNKVRYCMTDDEIAQLEDDSQSIKRDLQQRASIHLGDSGR